MASRFAHAEDAKQLGSALRMARLSRGWTQYQLGQACDMDRSQVSKIESGRARTAGPHVQNMCRVLGVVFPLRTDFGPTAASLAARIESLDSVAPQILPLLSSVLDVLELALAKTR